MKGLELEGLGYKYWAERYCLTNAESILQL